MSGLIRVNTVSDSVSHHVKREFQRCGTGSIRMDMLESEQTGFEEAAILAHRLPC